MKNEKMESKSGIDEFKKEYGLYSEYFRKLEELFEKKSSEVIETVKALNSQIADVTILLIDAEINQDKQKIVLLKDQETKILEDMSNAKTKLSSLKGDLFQNGVMQKKFEALIPLGANAWSELITEKFHAKDQMDEIDQKIKKLKKQRDNLWYKSIQTNFVLDDLECLAKKIFPEQKKIKEYLEDQFKGIMGV